MTDFKTKNEKQLERDKEKSAKGRNIFPIPLVVDQDRRDRCKDSLKDFCLTYFKESFPLDFSSSHLLTIELTEKSITESGLFAVALPRGSGKTTLLTVAILWSIFYGYSPYAVIVAATADKGKNLLKDIKTILESNDLLLEDFPEIVYPIRRLERIVTRAKGQHLSGVSTRIEMTANKIVFPTVEGSQVSGSVIAACGLTGGEIRGQKHITASGSVIRPSLVLIDDPQTSESAGSQTQTHTRHKILQGDILGMAGPDVKISGLIACTVIRKDDLADRLLDRKASPDWRGYKVSLIESFPKNISKWDSYNELRKEDLEQGTNKAKDYYIANLEAMKEGSKVMWEERKTDTDIDALQYAMDLYYRDIDSFMSEMQNTPLDEDTSLIKTSKNDFLGKNSGLKKGICPDQGEVLTAFIDIQKECLFYTVIAFTKEYGAYVIDYGSYPDQKTKYYKKGSLRRSLEDVFSGQTYEAQLYQALENLTEDLLGSAYKTESGAEIHIDRLLIDANYPESTDTVYTFCKRSSYASRVMPSHGRYMSPSALPYQQQQKKTGDKIGLNWRKRRGANGVTFISWDTNFWKHFSNLRMRLPKGEKAGVSFYGSPNYNHELLIDHLLAEYPTEVTKQGKTKIEYKPRPSRDNDFFDCFVGCFVAANESGLLVKESQAKAKRKKAISLSELQKNKKPDLKNKEEKKKVKLSDLKK